MKELIEKKLSVIVGLPLWNMGRSSSAVWFDFGSKLTEVPTRDGGKTLVGEYVIDTESAWHIVGPNASILVGSQDRLYPAGEDPYSNLLEFEWDKPNANRCDERLAMLLKEQKDSPLIVNAAIANNWGGLTITLSKEYTLEIFPVSSLNTEYWRFFQPAQNEKHFIVTAHGIE